MSSTRFRHKHPVFALADCNTFYVSCERVVQPHLEGKPMLAAALGLLGQISKQGIAFHKTGVLLTDLQPESASQPTFWGATSQDRESSKELMRVLDLINARYGKDTLQYACAEQDTRNLPMETKHIQDRIEQFSPKSGLLIQTS